MCIFGLGLPLPQKILSRVFFDSFFSAQSSDWLPKFRQFRLHLGLMFMRVRQSFGDLLQRPELGKDANNIMFLPVPNEALVTNRLDAFLMHAYFFDVGLGVFGAFVFCWLVAHILLRYIFNKDLWYYY